MLVPKKNVLLDPNDLKELLEEHGFTVAKVTDIDMALYDNCDPAVELHNGIDVSIASYSADAPYTVGYWDDEEEVHLMFGPFASTDTLLQLLQACTEVGVKAHTANQQALLKAAISDIQRRYPDKGAEWAEKQFVRVLNNTDAAFGLYNEALMKELVEGNF